MSLRKMLIASKMSAFGSGNSGGGNSGEQEESWFNDGNTHIWISLPEGRTSPMLGVGVNGTATIDWGDGSAPDTLTGTNVKLTLYTPTHEYGKAGDYVITVSGGQIGFKGSGSSGGPYFLRASSASSYLKDTDFVYAHAITKIELGTNVIKLGSYSFVNCDSLEHFRFAEGSMEMDSEAFRHCRSLESVHICGTTHTSISSDNSAFSRCSALKSVTLGTGVDHIGKQWFYDCNALKSIVIPDSATIIRDEAFYNCYALQSIVIPDGVTSIGAKAFYNCESLTRVMFPKSVTSIGAQAFYLCYSAFSFDFSKHTAVPTLSGEMAFNSIGGDFKILVPSALVDEWKAATNWSAYASNIVGV